MIETDNTQTDVNGLLEKLRSHLQSFSPAERKAAELVLRDPIKVLNQSVTELASAAGVSAATVVRMCNGIGLRGFQDLKTQIAVQHKPSNGQRKFSEHPIAEILQESAEALFEAAEAIDTASVELVADELINARRIHVVAVGTSSMLASDFSYRLSMLGVNVGFTSDVHAQHVQARMLGPGDLVFAISHTGSTFETISAVRSAREAGAKILALTSFSRSPLTELCDAYVIAGSAETKYRVEAVSSRLVHLAVLDAIQAILRDRIPTAEEGLKATAEVMAEHRY